MKKSTFITFLAFLACQTSNAICAMQHTEDEISKSQAPEAQSPHSTEPNVEAKEALYAAAAEGQVKTLEAFVEKFGVKQLFKQIFLTPITTGPDVDKTGLHVVAANGHVEILKYFVDKFGPEVLKIPITTGPEAGMTALHITAAHGHIEILKYFVDKFGPEVLMTPITTGPWAGWTALHAAANGWKALHSAATNEHVEILKYFVDKFGPKILTTPITTGPWAGWTALHLAASHGHIEILKYFVDKFGPEVLTTPITTGPWAGWTALYFAAANGHIEILKYFVDKFGPEVLTTPLATGPNAGWTALHAAAEKGCVEILKYFVDKFGPEVLTRPITTNPNAGWTALHLAAANGRMEILKYFVDKFGPKVLNTPINSPNTRFHNYTLLHIAARYGCNEFAQFLLNSKMDPRILESIALFHDTDTRDVTPCTPAKLAFKFNHPDTENLILLAMTKPIKTCLACNQELHAGNKLIRFDCGHAVTGEIECLTRVGNAFADKCPLCNKQRILGQEKVLTVSEDFLQKARASDQQPQINWSPKTFFAKECVICGDDIKAGSTVLRLCCGHTLCKDPISGLCPDFK